jgi:hypothetical protein
MPKKTMVTVPQGVNPSGSHRPVRGKPHQRAATDTPFEIPVYIRYERHLVPGTAEREGGYSSGELAGWAIIHDMFTFSTDVVIKIIRAGRGRQDKLVLSVNGKEVYSHTGKNDRLGIPPETISEGWATDEGRKHSGQKRTDQRKAGTHDIEPEEEEWEEF